MIGGMWKRKISSFLILFLLSIFIWHGVEINWIRKDLSHSPGMVLAGELRPLLKESTLFGYRLDVSTVEEVNFYLERVIPLLEEKEKPSEQTKKRGGGLVLMLREVYDEVGIQGDRSMVLVQEFKYKKGKLVLVSLRP
jgi:hypothetical protein